MRDWKSSSTLSLVFIKNLELTYEGLKIIIIGGYNSGSHDLELTYEGLKHLSNLVINLAVNYLELTYKRLKLDIDFYGIIPSYVI